MRHRSIAHILTSITLALGLFVLYQAWIKPTYFSPLALPSPQDAPIGFSPLSDHPPLGELFPAPEVPQTRLVTPASTPDIRLMALWEELERGNLKTVEPKLRRLPKEWLKSSRNKLYAAALWNNLGVQQEKFGGTELSVLAYQRAAALNPNNATIHLNLTQAYWARRDPAMTQDFLAHVIRLAPADPFPRLAMADILIGKGQFEPASRYLGDAAPATKYYPDLDAYARQLLARLPPELNSPHPSPTLAQRVPTAPIPRPPVAVATEKSRVPQAIPALRNSPPFPTPPPTTVGQTPRQLQPRTTDRFTIRFDGNEDQETWMRLRAVLEYAHQEMTQKFGYAPLAPIVVVLHTKQKFDNPAGTPAWADVLFDEAGGVIHVPGQGALDDLGLLSRVVRHEFAHALFQHKLGPQAAKVPRWLLEGLAVHLAEDPWPDVEDAKASASPLIPLRDLSANWKTLERGQTALAYLESASATQSLVDHYSMYEVRQLLNLIQAGQTLEKAMQNKLSTSYDSFERQWTIGVASGFKSGPS